MWTSLQYQLLKRIAPHGNDIDDTAAGYDYSGLNKLTRLFGTALLEKLRGKVVFDFGCGQGREAAAMAAAGAARVIGLELRPELLPAARENALRAGVGDVCEFVTATDEKADVIVSLDSFEHFSDPAAILRIMHGMLKPGGEVIASFGPTWLHPLGGHLFSVIPWAHLIFSEEALLRWRADIREDGAKRFSEVAGGLNQITIARFEKIVEASPLDLVSMETVPIGKLRLLHNRMTREWTTAMVRATLRKPV